jgi:putative salt-induced outer membrane protein YdiY
MTGEFLGRKGGRIIFRSTLAGELSVSEQDAVVVEAPETPVESLVGIPPEGSQLPSSNNIANSGLKAGKPKVPPWRGKVEFGFQQQSGRNDTAQLSVRADAERKKGPDSYRFEGRLLYSQQYRATTSDRYDGFFRYRHELSERVFTQAQSSYSRDNVKQINNDVEQNIGLGYRVINRPRHTGNDGGGVALQYRDAEGVESGITYLGQAFEDYTYKLTGRMTVSQEMNVAYSPQSRNRLIYLNGNYVEADDSASNYRLRFNTSLQGKVTERLSLNLRFEYEFDNAILDPKAKIDQRVTTSLGYGF